MVTAAYRPEQPFEVIESVKKSALERLDFKGFNSRISRNGKPQNRSDQFIREGRNTSKKSQPSGFFRIHCLFHGRLLEDFLDFTYMTRSVGHEVNFALAEHLHAQFHIVEKCLGFQLVQANERQLVDTAEEADSLEKCAVKNRHLGFLCTDVLSHHLMPDRIKKSRHIDAIGASRAARVAREAEPDTLGRNYRVYIAQNSVPNHLMRQKVHFRSYRASCRAFSALVTLVDH
jgi:hypothetical protein